MLPPRLRSRTPHANGSFPFPHQPDSPPRCWLKRKRSSISTPHHHHHHQHHRPSATTNTQPSPTQPVLSHPPHNPTFTHTHASPPPGCQGCSNQYPRPPLPAPFSLQEPPDQTSRHLHNANAAPMLTRCPATNSKASGQRPKKAQREKGGLTWLHGAQEKRRKP